jgi:hypothetical protein
LNVKAFIAAAFVLVLGDRVAPGLPVKHSSAQRVMIGRALRKMTRSMRFSQL